MIRSLGRLAAFTAIVMVSSAHIGSPDAWYEGPAGPYRVLIHIEAPPVVPGVAVVNVKTATNGVQRVTAFVNTHDAKGAAPPPDVAVAVAGNPGWHRAQLWVMTPGSQGVTVAVHGAQGVGSVVVPLSAVAGRRLDFDGWLAALLAAVGVFLALGLFTIVGAAVRESVLAPGVDPDSERHRRARRSIARAAVVVALVITGMGAWWRAADARFARALFQPLEISTRIDSDSSGRRLTFTITDSSWVRRDDIGWLRARGKTQLSGLVPDHGSLVHLFLVAANGKTAFAHLHPSTVDTVSFATTLPPLPAGTYRVFADVVHASGFSQTLTSMITLPDASDEAVQLGTSDDSWARGRSDPNAPAAELDDGSTVTWLRNNAPLTAGTEAGLRFIFARPVGDTAGLEPYLGMTGHAVVARDDGKVFIHLHPLGTISVAAQALLTPAVADHGAGHEIVALSDTLYFPYAFPEAGTYSVWVQLKRHGRVMTALFSAAVGLRQAR
jgi:hypothetical protein